MTAVTWVIIGSSKTDGGTEGAGGAGCGAPAALRPSQTVSGMMAYARLARTA